MSDVYARPFEMLIHAHHNALNMKRAGVQLCILLLWIRKGEVFLQDEADHRNASHYSTNLERQINRADMKLGEFIVPHRSGQSVSFRMEKMRFLFCTYITKSAHLFFLNVMIPGLLL